MTLPTILWPAVFLACLFHAAWLFARRVNNYGIVDVVWSYAFAPIAVAVAWLADGWGPRRAVLAAIVVFWSLRLGTHLLRRVAKHHPVEDPRYTALRTEWAEGFCAKMALFFQMQGVSVLVLMMPIVLAAQNQSEVFAPLEWAGLAVWFIALAGEAVADSQLSAHKRAPATRDQVCDRGLWRYSRHPNYFFEWLVWVGYALIAASAPWGFLGWTSPIAMLYLLLRVTGIPMAEERSLRTKGDAYRDYQRRTSAFFPLPPKRLS